MKRRDQEREERGHPAVWAFLTIVAFPLVLIASDALGAPGLWPFVIAVLVTLGIFILELLVRGGMWPMEKEFEDFISHPATPLRMLMVLGATLLILETALIFTVVTNRQFDPELVRFVMARECSLQHGAISTNVCGVLERVTKTDDDSRVSRSVMASAAMRARAASTWLPQASVTTCSDRSFSETFDAQTGNVRQARFIECFSWGLSSQGQLRVLDKKYGTVAALMDPQQDGSYYQVTRWSDNPNSDEWNVVLGDQANSDRQKAISFGVLPEFESVLQKEALQRATALLLGKSQ